MTDPLAPFFLGAYGENNDFFEKTLLELVRDHVFWRRNFHPEDEPPISTHDQYTRAYLDGLARTRHELHQLTAALKRSVPSFHPRYLGHMVSDLLHARAHRPAGHHALQPEQHRRGRRADHRPARARGRPAARAHARVLAWTARRSRCALGHLTSGGTVANDEALWLARSARLYPLALRDACAATGLWVPDVPVRAASTDAELLALGRGRGARARPPRRGLLRPRARAAPSSSRRSPPPGWRRSGSATFAERHPALRRSWRWWCLGPRTTPGTRRMNLLGLGRREPGRGPGAARPVSTARRSSRCSEALRREGRPVLAVVGVYGTTEFGTLDSLHELLAVRRRFPGFWLHVDAAWGGYLPTLFRDRKGHLLPREAVREGFHYFPSERVHRATAALAEADSVTVDPAQARVRPLRRRRARRAQTGGCSTSCSRRRPTSSPPHAGGGRETVPQARPVHPRGQQARRRGGRLLREPPRSPAGPRPLRPAPRPLGPDLRAAGGSHPGAAAGARVLGAARHSLRAGLQPGLPGLQPAREPLARGGQLVRQKAVRDRRRATRPSGAAARSSSARAPPSPSITSGPRSCERIGCRAGARSRPTPTTPASSCFGTR